MKRSTVAEEAEEVMSEETEEVEPEETEEVEPEEIEEVEPEAETPEPKQEPSEWQTRLSKVESDLSELKAAARRKVRHSPKPKPPEPKPEPEKSLPTPKHSTIQTKRFLGKLFKSKNPDQPAA